MRGFTLIELILILAIIGVMSLLTLPFLQSFQVSSDLATSGFNLLATLRQAQRQAQTGQDNSNWGVYFDDGNHQFILFRGDSFASREPSEDQVATYSEIFSFQPDFGDQIVFSLFNGQPSASGIVQISGTNNQVRVILIAADGQINIGN